MNQTSHFLPFASPSNVLFRNLPPFSCCCSRDCCEMERAAADIVSDSTVPVFPQSAQESPNTQGEKFLQGSVPIDTSSALGSQNQPSEPKSFCPYCEQDPCCLQDGLYDALTAYEEFIREADTEEKLTNKEVRFQLYREAIRHIHGHMGKGRRVKLLLCVETEIRDLAPEGDRNYVGFKDGTVE
jgi:hypothetical protein